MRWYWIDKYTEFVSGQKAVATKCVTLGEAHLLDYYYGHPVMPNSLVLEGFAQTGGILLAESTGYEAQIVLAKVSKSVFHFKARPGDTLEYSTVIENQGKEGALIVGTSRRNGEVQADIEMYLAILGEKYGGQRLFQPGHYFGLLSLLGVYDVAVSAEGERLEMPEKLVPAVIEQGA